MKPALSATPIALTVELPFNEVARGNRPPLPLSRSNAEALADTIGRDIQRLLGDVIYDVGMVCVGALYDLPELLQPGLPAVEALSSVYRDAMPSGEFVPSVLAIGGQGGRFPIPSIAPTRQAGAGPLLALPIVVVAPQQALDQVTPILEEKLLHTGQAGLDTTRMIHSGFGIQPENLTYATFNDLCALMKVQLEHSGFGPLWNLIENALFQRSKPTREILDSGNIFLWMDGQVGSPFFTLDEWLSQSTKEPAPTLDGYLHWLRVQRQYCTGLQSHQVPISLLSPDARLSQSDVTEAVEIATACYLDNQRIRSVNETSTDDLSSAKEMITVEHSAGKMGPIAITIGVVTDSGETIELTHHYPLWRDSIDQIYHQARVRAQQYDLKLTLREPGEVRLDPDTGQLALS